MSRTLMALAFLLGCNKSEPDTRPTETPIDEVGALVFDGGMPKNVLMISIDTLRRDHVGRYVDGESPTPWLDNMMKEGVVLDDFTQCANWTFASIMCTLAGKTNIENEYIPKFEGEYRQFVPNDLPTLASRMSEAGWSTYYESTNHWFGPLWRSDQGYDTRVETGIFHAEGVIGEVADAVASDAPDRWLMHVHIKEPHPPYNPLIDYLGDLDDLEPIGFDLGEYDEHYEATNTYPYLEDVTQELLEAHLRVRYRGELQWMDQMLTDAFVHMDELGLLDDTLVVFWSDHGEAFWDRGHQTHAYTMHAEENDAVAFFWANNLAPVVWTEPTTSIDIVPTVLQAVGIASPTDLTGELVGTADPRRIRHGFTTARLGAISTAERDDIKVIFRWTGQVRAYDRSVDPNELNDIWDPSNAEIAEIWAALAAQVEAAAPMVPELPVTWPEGV